MRPCFVRMETLTPLASPGRVGGMSRVSSSHVVPCFSPNKAASTVHRSLSVFPPTCRARKSSQRIRCYALGRLMHLCNRPQRGRVGGGGMIFLVWHKGKHRNEDVRLYIHIFQAGPCGSPSSSCFDETEHPFLAQKWAMLFLKGRNGLIAPLKQGNFCIFSQTQF